jgi:hypothetical protein
MEEGRTERMRIHKNTNGLEWFRLLERNTLCLLFLCCSSKILKYRV